MREQWTIPALGLTIASAGIAALVIWALWPIECTTTDIGFLPGTSDPNIRSCTRRLGGAFAGDAADAQAAALKYGFGAAASLLVVAIATMLWRTRSQRA